MKNMRVGYFLPILGLVFLTACGRLSNEVDSKLEELKGKTEQMDALINKEVDKVLMLDSLIDREKEKVIKLDSLISSSASRMDSVSREKLRQLETIIK